MIEQSICQTNTNETDTFLGRSIGDNERYRIESCLGKGGMGSVYQAIDRKLGKRVAIKRFNAALNADQTSNEINFRSRFERECVICAALTNENVVQVSDYGITTEDEPFYVMEYLEGKTLEQLLEEDRQIPIERAKKIMVQVCHGLQAAHEGVSFKTADMADEQQIKIVHRDLKPSNIFLVPTLAEERVKIIDFGVAKVQPVQTDNPNVTNIFLGTYHYAAPEQIDCQAAIDERSDIYCLGLILYEMLSGVDPFGLGARGQHITGESWISAHLLKSVQPIRSQPGCEAISVELENIILRCLEKHPDYRFSSVKDLAQALESEQSIQPVSSGDVAISIAAQPNSRRLAIVPSTLAIAPSTLLTQVSHSSRLLYGLSQTLFHSVLGLVQKSLAQVIEVINQSNLPQNRSKLKPSLRASTQTPLNVISVDLIDRCQSELTFFVGPAARLMVEKTLQETQYHEPQKFIETLAACIPDREAATQFRQIFI